MILVPITDVSAVWELAKGNIEKVIDKFEDLESIEDIYADLLIGDRQLWMVLKDGDVVASVITMINEYRGKRWGILTHAGGHDAQDWFHIVNPIGEYFKAEGCQKFIIQGRKGWSKFLKDFRSDNVIYEKAL